MAMNEPRVACYFISHNYKVAQAIEKERTPSVTDKGKERIPPNHITENTQELCGELNAELRAFVDTDEMVLFINSK